MRQPRLGLMILALVLGLRVLIPPGMMPVADPARGFVVTLCEGTGPATPRKMTLFPGSASKQNDSKADPGPCAFGVLASALLGGAEPMVLPAPTAPAMVPASRAAHALVLAGLAHARPPARAPPVSLTA
jgi:hypothetical protein